MNDVAQCTQFIANSIKVTILFVLKDFFILFSFCSFRQLVVYSHH